MANYCCVSSVRGAGVIEPRVGGPVEYSISRRGGNYRHFDLPSDPTGKACLEACKADKRCRAFTYVRPGYGRAVRAMLSEVEDSASQARLLLRLWRGAVTRGH